MSCLLPQFKSPPDLFPLLTKSHHHSVATNLQSKCREPVRTHCLSSTSSAALLLDLENFSLPILEDCSNSIGAHRTWTYVRGSSSDTEGSFGATLASEASLTSEEAVGAAAAAEAIALAKAAAKVARAAALMAGKYHFVKPETPSDSEIIQLKRAQLIETERVSSLQGSMPAEAGMEANHFTSHILEEAYEREPTLEEIKHLQDEFSRSVAVRSDRRTRKKNRKTKVADKVHASGGVSIKSGSASRKKRGAVPEVVSSDPLRYLRGTTGTSKLLTAKEEMELSAGIQELLKLEGLRGELAERCGSQPSFRQWAAAAGVDQNSLRSRVNHGILCKDKMIKSNIRLVISIAKKYQGAGLNIQDLVQEGCRGLVRGAEKFDASKGFKFSTYAHWWIKQAIKKSLSDQSRTIRLPFHIVEATYRVKEARKELYSENGRHPTNEEVAAATGLSMKRLMAVLQAPKHPKSLDQKIGNNLDLKPSEIMSDPKAETAEEVLAKQFMKQDLDRVLNSLTPREKQVVRWRFGMEDGRMKTLQEIGELMEVSRERIRQIETCAFRKLKNKKRTEVLQQYIHA
uniref:RNA polymerase sigma factor n=1 Tax=Kalanchoe fedtschenkoi TaxID=63787 RepID=A0A7N0U656_KALFE